MRHNDSLRPALILIKLPDNATGMLPQLMKPTGLSSVWCQGTCGTSKKACVSGGVNYPLKPVTPGYQDAALTEVKRAQRKGPIPSKHYCIHASSRGWLVYAAWFAGRSLIE